MIDQVAALLRGKTAALIRALTAEMEQLAADMKFEEAARVRDRIRGLEAYGERQKASDLDATDRDISALAAEGSDACGVVFLLREGKMISRRHYYLGNVEGKGELTSQSIESNFLNSLSSFTPPSLISQT